MSQSVDEQEIIDEAAPRRPRRRLRRLLLALLILLIAGLGILWSMREKLATDYFEGELARRGVQASYEVKRIGFGSQILENVVIGDPARPDATIRRLEVGIALGLYGPEVGTITVRGVRLRGSIVDGQVSLGQIDRLLPEPTGAPFALPDQRIDVADAGIALETPAGLVALALTGRGNLADGFRGQMAMTARALEIGGCAIEAPRANVAVAVDELRPSLRGPAAAQAARCGDMLAARPRVALALTLASTIDSWRGGGALRIDRLAAGANRAANVEGRLTFAGNAARTQGRADLWAGALDTDGARTARARIAGPYALSLDRGEALFGGEIEAAGLRLGDAALGGAVASLRGASGTPVGPIAESLADALARAGREGAEARAQAWLASGPGFGAARVNTLRLDGAGGARLLIDGGSGATYFWPAGRLRLDGDFALSGGGFPETRFTLRQASADGPLEGAGRIAPIRAGETSLTLSEIRFAASPGGETRFRTAARLDGPFSGGRVRGLTLPIDGRFGRGGFALGESCVAAGFEALEVQNLRLGATRLPLCPEGRAMLWQGPGGSLQGGARIDAPRFAGRLGSSPVAFAAARLRVGPDGFAATDFAARLGEADAVNRLDIASLDGRFGEGVAGDFAGLSGDLAAVPLLVDGGAGRWRFAGGELVAEGGINVADKQDPVRFYPLISHDFRLAISGSDLTATGGLDHPGSGTRVMRATIVHDLSSGAGNAMLDVEGLRFHPGFQPDLLTPLTIGVIALVDGSVTGQGRIAWDEAGTRSTGTFATQGMNLAAPFGPVQGLTTRIEFTDLLGLATAPGQTATVDLVQAGIDVFDGVLTYQLRPDYRVAIESARWPFAGGTLTLDPTALDFSRESTKYLTFRVDGLDAARFVEQMEFGNIAATGTFDGVVPMQFDENGSGRILNGRLSARPEGGTLSYVGELTDRDLGAYGILAFNALKSLRYDKFDLILNGALDGEFVTVIDLDGVARDPEGTALPSGGGIPQMVAGRVLGQLARIPFQFNIRIQGQFRSLIATTRSFSDPSLLIQSVLPRALSGELETPVQDVQPEESEPVR
ncbi:MAG: YdbH domain-containing protein [Sphingomonas sp.]|nr:YdbH domain-containing protein [Sphingomonas sp.]